MAEYIEREGLIEWLKRIPLIDLSDGRGLCRVIMEDDFKKAIKKMPKSIIADVAPVRHGRWITTSGEVFPGSSQFLCYSHKHEECGFQYVDMDENEYDYCPNCGAKMDLKEEQHELRRDL